MKRCVIIAEAGVNHNGDLETALRLVDAAADAGADYVKFQTFKARNLVTAGARKAAYQERNMGEEGSQYDMLRRLELSEEDHKVLIARCDERGIKFLSTPFDPESIDFLRSLGLDLWKIPSGEITNYPFLCKIARQGGEVIMSTGMSTPSEVEEALAALRDNGQDMEKVTILHCNTQYPTPMEDVNLNAMLSLRALCKHTGYSDHTLGIEIPVAAAALGAEIIEKHFTLSRDMPGPDHAASLEPSELKKMVKAIRNVEKALGDGEKKVTGSESGNRDIARKSIVASRPIKKGEILSESNLTTKRPGGGISPMRWREVCGSKAIRDFEEDEMIEL